MIKLARLNSLSKNTQIHLAETDTFIVYSSQFFLLSLLTQAMNFALVFAGPKKEIQISLHPMINGIRITFSGIAANKESFSIEKPEILAKALSAEVSLDAAAGELHIELPQRISETSIQNLLSDR
jgi:hypothetical protein